jgi:hypothetical protein
MCYLEYGYCPIPSGEDALCSFTEIWVDSHTGMSYALWRLKDVMEKGI